MKLHTTLKNFLMMKIEGDFETGNPPALLPEFKRLTDLVRKYVKKFKKSPVKNYDHLQPMRLEHYQKFKSLSIDCKNRWKSLKNMVQELLNHWLAVRHAMENLRESFEISNENISSLKELAEILSVLEADVNELSKRDANLLDFEKCITFTRFKLDNLETPLAFKVLKKFEDRIQERRNPKLIHLIKYLENPKFIKGKKDQFDITIVRKDTESMIHHHLLRLFPNLDTTDTNENEPDPVKILMLTLWLRNMNQKHQKFKTWWRNFKILMTIVTILTCFQKLQQLLLSKKRWLAGRLIQQIDRLVFRDFLMLY